MASEVTLQFKKGSHVFTMQDSSGEEIPVIMLSWEEARAMAKMFNNPHCQEDPKLCMPCGLREDLIEMIVLRGPKHG